MNEAHGKQRLTENILVRKCEFRSVNMVDFDDRIRMPSERLVLFVVVGIAEVGESYKKSLPKFKKILLCFRCSTLCAGKVYSTQAELGLRLATRGLES